MHTHRLDVTAASGALGDAGVLRSTARFTPESSTALREGGTRGGDSMGGITVCLSANAYTNVPLAQEFIHIRKVVLNLMNKTLLLLTLG